MGGVTWKHILVVEDDAATNKRRSLIAIGGAVRHTVHVRLHSVGERERKVLAERSYQAGRLVSKRGSGKAALALSLIDEHAPKRNAVVVAGATYGSNLNFLQGLLERELPFVVEVRPSELYSLSGWRRLSRRYVGSKLRGAEWQHVKALSPSGDGTFEFAVASVDGMTPHLRLPGSLFAAQAGAIGGLHRGTIFGYSSASDVDLDELVRAVVWARWIRPTHRREVRAQSAASTLPPYDERTIALRDARLTVRTSIANADRQDERLLELERTAPALQGALADRKQLNVVELFAGAGGMGLGFLLADAGRYRIIHSAEVSPIYVSTLRRNHAYFAGFDKADRVPESVEPVDLRTKRSLDQARAISRARGGIDLLIGGPPCQGFSNANRNSWSRTNPNNRLFERFVDYVVALQPHAFVMENVQGVLWTSKAGGAANLSIVDHVARRLERAGYIVFPRLLDAVWFGVPQYRSRFFLVGLHRDLGYRKDSFGAWGPFPYPTHGRVSGLPYVTVRKAISDLPARSNGSDVPELRYNDENRARNAFLTFVREHAPQGVIYDHVTSRHADYVIERYRRIPPGGNWEDVSSMMSNYADVSRTHSNIYRRLTWDQPAITIGHYRKAMLIHPRQHRGLSLREASRLQSFPDWFRLAGSSTGSSGGLVHKQQQLANAVCPLVTKALAEYLLAL
jgi:DNA-cytosine methyltransferase